MNKIIILAVLLAVGSCAIKKAPVHFVDTKTVLAEVINLNPFIFYLQKKKLNYLSINKNKLLNLYKYIYL